MGTRWSAIERAAQHDPTARLPWRVDGRVVGSVARAHLELLRELQAPLEVDEQGLTLALPPAGRDVALHRLHLALREAGVLKGWRDETFELLDPATDEVLAHIERAAARFWGALTLGAHATGYVAGADGRPAALWIAQRAWNKATDPGRFDNLIGGGVPAGQSPWEALVREGWEEAGLMPDEVRLARAGRVLRLVRDIPEGLQHERIHAFELALPVDRQPSNQDGEVAGFRLLPVDEALELAAGDTMTVDAALVTLEFALRHGLLPAAQAARLEARSRDRWVGPG